MTAITRPASSRTKLRIAVLSFAFVVIANSIIAYSLARAYGEMPKIDGWAGLGFLWMLLTGIGVIISNIIKALGAVQRAKQEL